MIRRFGPWPVLALLLSLALPAGPLRADGAESGAQICERAIIAGARRAGLPQDVLHAISLTETGRARGGRLRPYPWAINREGKGFWFQNRDEALAFARASLAAGRRSFDVGCFQINYLWHGANFASLEAMFDPDTGADYAAPLPRRASTPSAATGRRRPAPIIRRRRPARTSIGRASTGSSPASTAGHRSPSPRPGRRRRRAAGGARGPEEEPDPALARAADHHRHAGAREPRARRPSRPPPTLRSWRT